MLTFAENNNEKYSCLFVSYSYSSRYIYHATSYNEDTDWQSNITKHETQQNMIDFPIAKINLGLNIVSKRSDGYHNLETVFYPVPITDALEIQLMDDKFPSTVRCDLKVTNMEIGGCEQDNLIVRAYKLLSERFPLPRIHAHLFKGIPMQAGMGGGSSDCASMIKLLNNMFNLGMSNDEMIDFAMKLGADCPFFILGTPQYAEGIGEKLEPIEIDLHGWTLAVVCPKIPVSTKEAFSCIKPCRTKIKCREIIKRPVETWRGHLNNDFEESVFAMHPEIGSIKQKLYDIGATYASMSGSGSSVYGLFHSTINLEGLFGDAFTHTCVL